VDGQIQKVSKEIRSSISLAKTVMRARVEDKKENKIIRVRRASPMVLGVLSTTQGEPGPAT